MTYRILCVEDNPEIGRMLVERLADEGHHCDRVSDGESALIALEGGASVAGYDLVMLDLMLPGLDGLEVCRRLRRQDSRTPVLMVTAKAAIRDVVLGLEIGADDYVTKPFDTDELLARIRVALRHREGTGADLVKQLGAIRLDLNARQVSKNGEAVYLTPKEFALFAELARFPGRVLTHDHLLKAVWGEAHRDDVEYLRVAVRSIRQKLEDDPAQPSLVINDPGVGYRLKG